MAEALRTRRPGIPLKYTQALEVLEARQPPRPGAWYECLEPASAVAHWDGARHHAMAVAGLALDSLADLYHKDSSWQ